MPAGRPKKSQAVKGLAGTDQKSRTVEVIPPPETLPTYHKPPPHLNEIGIKAYWDIVAHLRSVDALWSIDKYIIEHAAYWTQVYMDAVLAVKGNYIQKFKTGAKQISPEMQVLNMAEKNVQEYFSLLGIGQKSREQIGSFQVGGGGGSSTKDPYDELMKVLLTTDAEIVDQ